jgi:hypothetical protein
MYRERRGKLARTPALIGAEFGYRPRYGLTIRLRFSCFAHLRGWTPSIDASSTG